MENKAKKNEKRAVALYSIIAAIGLIAGKTTVGIMTGSLAILTDALHSLLDLGGSIITYFAVRISDKPADRDHHFGHGKVESLAALAQVLILFITCGGIIYEAVGRLKSGSSAVDLNIWAFIVIIIAIGIDISRVRSLRRVAKKYSSQALAADALNFSTDIYSSLVVLFGLLATQLGVVWADAAAAIGVAIFIISAVIRMAKQSIDVLLDRAPAETEKTVREIVSDFSEILNIDRIRVRSDGRMTFADMVLDIDRTLSLSRADDLTDRLKQELHMRLPQSDVTFTLNPVSPESEKVADTVHYVVSSFGLSTHHLIISEDQGQYFISMHIEMHGGITLEAAHHKAGLISKKLHESIENLKKVVIHTQPHKLDQPGEKTDPTEAEPLRRRVKEIIESFPGVEDCHNIILTPHKKGFALSADMRLDGNLPLIRTDQTSKEVEEKLRSQIEELVSITLHLEPLENK
jgi:cation diffusion facilitator family transporter